jgi:hypothetical protein
MWIKMILNREKTENATNVWILIQHENNMPYRNTTVKSFFSDSRYSSLYNNVPAIYTGDLLGRRVYSYAWHLQLRNNIYAWL